MSLQLVLFQTVFIEIGSTKKNIKKVLHTSTLIQGGDASPSANDSTLGLSHKSFRFTDFSFFLRTNAALFISPPSEDAEAKACLTASTDEVDECKIVPAFLASDDWTFNFSPIFFKAFQ